MSPQPESRVREYCQRDTAQHDTAQHDKYTNDGDGCFHRTAAVSISAAKVLLFCDMCKSWYKKITQTFAYMQKFLYLCTRKRRKRREILGYMNFRTFGNIQAPTLLLIPGLGVSYELFLPLIRLTEDKFRIIAAEVDGFTLGTHTRFTSVDDQAAQVIDYIKVHYNGHLDGAYGLSLGGKILSRIIERNELIIDHAVLDAAPLLPLPNWLINPLRYYQAANVWTCYHWTGFWKFVFHSHYFDVLLDECRKIWPWGGKQAVLDGYKSVYTSKLERIYGNDIHFWYGTKEAFAAKPQVKHLLTICPSAHVQIFKGMNHGQLLIDHPDEVAKRINDLMAKQ